MYSHDTKAVCRGCGTELRGKPYYMGGDAYHPTTGARAKKSCFGGYLCSEVCDRRSYLEQEQSMPGHRGQRDLDPNISRKIAEKWAIR